MKLKRRLLITISAICFVVFTSQVSTLAQVIIRGKVIDYASRLPVYGANIYFPDLKTGTESGEDGSFEIRFNAPVNTIMQVSHIGYEQKKIPVELADGVTNEITIYLIPGSLKMGEVMVTGDRVKQTVFNSSNFISVKTAEEFANIDKKSTADVLKEEPGILVQKTTHAHGSPVIRGLIGKYVLLMYNGIRLNRPTMRFGANQYLNTVSAEALHRIEVTRGPASVLYGSDAIGGTINLISEKYESEGPELKVFPSFKIGYSTVDKAKTATMFLKGSKGIYSFSGNISYNDIGDLDPGGAMKIQNPTGWKEMNGSLSMFIEPSPRNKIEFDFLHVNQSDVPRFDKYVTGEYEEYVYDPQKRSLFSISYTNSPPLSWLHQFKANVSYQMENEGRTLTKTGSSSTRFDDDEVKTLGAYLQFSSILRNKHWLNWGADFYRDKVYSARTVTDIGLSVSERGAFPDNSIYNSFGIYFQENYILDHKFDLGIGVRYSLLQYESPLEQPWGLLDDSFSDLNGSLSLSYKTAERFNIIGSYSRGFRAPNFNDTVVLKFSNSGFDAPSPWLKAEVSHNYEIGIKVDGRQLKGGMFVFFNRMNDLIDRRFGTYKGLSFYDEDGDDMEDPGEVPVFQKFNVGTADIYGTEFHTSYRFEPFYVSGNLFYTYGENTTNNEPMSRIPPLMGKLGIQWYPNDRIWLEAYSRFASKQDRISARDVLDTRIPDGGTPGYFTFNLRGAYSFNQGKIVIRFENLFDELYKEHGSGIFSPGRGVSVMYQFTPVR